MKELFIFKVFGVDIIAREPIDYPEELKNIPLDKQLQRAKKFII